MDIHETIIFIHIYMSSLHIYTYTNTCANIYVVGNILVFGPPLHRGIELRSLRQSSGDGYSVSSGLFLAQSWWSVGVAAVDGVRPGLGCMRQEINYNK